MSNHELIEKVQYLQELRRMGEELEGEIEAVQNQIKAHMTAHDLTELVAGAFRVTWQTVVQSRLDARALTRDYPELAEKYTRSTSSRRFQVK